MHASAMTASQTRSKIYDPEGTVDLRRHELRVQEMIMRGKNWKGSEEMRGEWDEIGKEGRGKATRRAA